MSLAAAGENGRLLQILKGRRTELLEAVHDSQQALDSLDYLIFQTEKRRKQV